jgi:hypothetical protein
MSCYISSNDNRFYVGLETTYGTVPAIHESNRIPGVKLTARQVAEQTKRRDKTGSRTFPGLPNTIRRRTAYQLNTFLTEWSNQAAEPAYGPLFQGAMGANAQFFTGGVLAATDGFTSLTFTSAHGLAVGQGVSYAGEIRFVAAIQSGTAIYLNAPFANAPTAGASLGSTVTYSLAKDLSSVSIFDYWTPSTVVQRILQGAAVDRMRVKVNGDFQEFSFGGPARDLLDSASFTSGQGGLTTFPAEPAQTSFDYTIVPGHLGQVWMGATPTRFYTLTEADLTLENNIELRTNEFGRDYPSCITAGIRNIHLNFRLFEQDNAQTKALYQAARQRSPIGVMLQLGQQNGQLFGAYMPAMVPEVPEFDDGETRLQWSFQNSRAQGSVNDELFVAFG